MDDPYISGGDRWLSHSDHNAILMPQPIDGVEMFVSDLIDQGNRVRNTRLIKEIFLPMDILYITVIPLSRRPISDCLMWPYSKDCVYTIRSRYHWLREIQDAHKVTTSGDTIKWNRLWKLNIPPKIKILFWRLLHNVLSCNVNLQTRCVQIQVNCARCDKVENLHHISLWGMCGQLSYGL